VSHFVSSFGGVFTTDMGEPTVAQSSLSISTSAAEVRSVFELFQEDDFYAQFLERGFDSSRFAGAILTQDMATSTTGSDSKRRADPSDLPHQKRLGAQEAVIKIEAGVKQLDDELSKQVVAHHEELLHQVADVRELERVLEHVRDGVNALEDGVSALQLSVREPYSQLAASVGELERVQAVTDLLRRTFRYLSLAARLRELVQEKNTGTRYLPQAAICLRDIHDLEGEQEQEDDELMQVEVVAEQLEFVRQVYTNTINTASHLLNQGLSAHNQTDVATALQVFHNLGVLKARTYQCMADLVLHARHAIQSSLTHACFRDAEFAREVAGSRGQQTAEIRRREAVWAQLSRIADDLFACVLRGWTLQRVLSKMRDPTTHQPLVAPLSQAGALAAPFNTGSSAVTGATRSKDHLQPSHGGQSLQEDYQNVASLNPAREAASLLVQRFWAPLCEAFSGELGKVSRANPALAALLGATGYPRLLALFSARLLQRLTEQRRQVQAEQATQERVLLLRALSSFESAFLAAAQRAIRIPLAALISDAAPSPNTIADAPTEQQVAALLHAIGVQLGAVRAVDSDLCTLVAQQAVHAVQQFTVHAERMVASAPADHQTVDALTPAQLRNAHLFNALAQLRRGLLAEADRLPSISAAAYSSTASSPASVSIASTTGTTSTTSALSSSVIGADQLTRTAGSKVNTLSSSSSSSSPSSSSSSKQVASSTAPSGAPQRRDAASLLRNCAAVLASLAQQITGPLFICMSSVAHRTLLKMHSELCADTDSQQQQQQQQQGSQSTQEGTAGSHYMTHLQRQLTHFRNTILAPYRPCIELTTHLKLLVTDIVDAFVTQVSLLRTLTPTARMSLAHDMAKLELAVLPLHPAKGVGVAYQHLRSLRPLLFRELDEVANCPELTQLPPMVVLHSLYARGPPELVLPHRLRGWSESHYVRWLNEHPLASERLQLIRESLDAYRREMDRRGAKQYSPVYVLIGELASQFFEHS